MAADPRRERQAEPALAREIDHDAGDHQGGDDHLDDAFDPRSRALEIADDQQHGDDGQVLGDQDGEAKAPGFGLVLTGLLQHLDGDGGGRERRDEGEDHRQFHRPSKKLREAQGEEKECRQLGGQGDQRQAPELHEIDDVKLHADHEKKHENAEMGEQLDLLLVLHQFEGGGTEENAGEDVARHRRQAETRHDHAAKKRRKPDDGDPA